MIPELKEKIGLEIRTNKNSNKWEVYKNCIQILKTYENKKPLNDKNWNECIDYITDTLYL